MLLFSLPFFYCSPLLLLPMKAVNFGVSGDRTDSMLWRMEDTKLAVKTSPRYCVLLAGTNNIGRWKGRQPAAQTVKGIREIAVRLLKPDGTFREGMFRDHVHLTEKGYQAWADALLPLLNGEG
ncbi:hypothetical protein [Akkermansia muciniphila]|uniref:hypothetical protein n=1 Tax=Akkermansia muciniphila TaxID=239935 RepID=UPI0027D315A0|nr:hypothetical protein [Akkermansia muciniphila]WMB15676.1 hypothetical protein O4G22_01995 [Akkermansia muciniphila]WMB20251.1 hypothetical protein O4G19_02020 [Akkermansia muciniphila]